MQKREVSILIPFYSEDTEVFVFLQRRSSTAKRLPGFFGFFGGGLELGEIPEVALKREIKEELCIEPLGYEFFSRYEFYGSIKNIYTMQIDKNFSEKIKLGEGDFGKFFSEREAATEEKMIDEDKVVLRNFFGKIKRNNPFS